MGMEIRQLHPLFAGEVGGIDLAQPLDAAAVGAIWEAIDRYAVLVFHDQCLSDEQLRDFARNFGGLEIGRSAAEGGKRRRAPREIGDISTREEAGRLRERNDRRRLDSLGNRIWHTDASYMPVPVVLGMLHAVAVPPVSALGGGETEFADMRAAYDALPGEMRDAIDGLVAEHDIFWSRGQIGFTEFLPGEREKYPPSLQRLIRRHAGSKRKTLYLSAHASHIVGWPVPEAASCSTTSICTQPGGNSSTATNGGSAMSSSGTTAARSSRPPARRFPSARSAPRDNPRCRLE